jgi:hypothetical protein
LGQNFGGKSRKTTHRGIFTKGVRRDSHSELPAQLYSHNFYGMKEYIRNPADTFRKLLAFL